MSFISYAQNYEDVILWRALGKVESGFYIDVGAAWPDLDSVTKAFYDQGWSGLNIEPNPGLFSKLSAERSRDINLQIAISNQPGEADIYLIGETGISTFETEIAERHAIEGWTSTQITVPVETLTMVWSQHVPVGQEVHFLKVDVEGLEKSVLDSNDWTRFRPWIVVVEATLPLSQVDSYEDWEHLMFTADYNFVYADGLNRFYLAAEHKELQSAFKYPPNLFDGFISHTDNSLRWAEDRIQTLETELSIERKSTYRWWSTAYRLQHEIMAIHRSPLWRLTAPLRRLKQNSRNLNRFSDVLTLLSAQGKQLSRRSIQWGVTTAAKQPVLKANLLSFLNCNPNLEKRIKKLIARHRAGASTSKNTSSWAAIEDLNNNELSILNRRLQIDAESPDDVFQVIATEIALSPEAQVLSSQPKGD
jgi:FkbM family methyltransferase